MSLHARLQDQALTRRPPHAAAAVILTGVVLAALSWAALLAQSTPAPAAPAAPGGPATLVIEWPSRRIATETGTRALDTPVLPGALAQVFALAAAVDAGLVAPSSTHLCRRVATADGRRFVCTHPDLGRPLTLAEALAYSCTDFFAHLAARLPREALNDVRRRAGLEPVAGNAPWTSSVLGLAGPRSSPRSLFSAVTRIAGVGPDAAVSMKAATREVVRTGLRGAPGYGAAAAMTRHGRPALVKASTSPLPGGRALGLVMAFAPIDAPTRAVLVASPSGEGVDAAELAAQLLTPAARVLAPSSPSTMAVPGPVLAAAPSSTPAAPGLPVTDAVLRAVSGAQVVRVGVALPNGTVRIDTLPMEEYVARVISGEGQPRAGAAAHEALAIVIRTFALANRHRHRSEGYDLCDSTHCQVMRPALAVAREAALATAGRVLLDKGQPAFVYYSAHCGGIPALASEVWPGAVDYPPGDAHDDACADERPWSTELTPAQIERALRAAGLSGRRLKALSVTERTTSQRAGRLAVDGFAPASVSAYEFRMAVGRTLGWQLVRSTAFDVSRTDDGYRFRGVGYGHGVGLCVVGAGKRAARGETSNQILRAYFGDLAQSTVAATMLTSAPRPTTAPQIGAPPTPHIGAAPVPQMSAPGSLPSAPPAAASASDIRLTLAPHEEGERSYVLDLVRRTRTDVATRAGIAVPATMTVTVHATVEAFSRATGQPWWGAASTVGAEIDLLPLAELRRRGTLESTVRQEVAHVVLDAALMSRPVWVREGASIYFSSPAGPPQPPGARVACPKDAELLRPVSGGAEREAFSRADRCFRRQIAEGRAWRDVR
jgi:SpoIID/LytB domain protein